MLQQNEQKETNPSNSAKNANLAKRSTSMKDGKIKSNDLLFAFNFENKYKCINKVSKYSQFKKVPSAKGKRKPNLVYPDTIESSNMISMMLSKSATMKYQKVREYLQQKSLDELKQIRKIGPRSIVKTKHIDVIDQDEDLNGLSHKESLFIINKENNSSSFENLNNKDIYYPK